MIENRIIANNSSSIVLYTTDDGNTRFEVKLEKNIVWLTQSQMVELFDIDRTIVEDTWEKCINQKNWKNFQLVQKMYKGGKTKRVNMWSVWKWMIALVFKVLGWSRGEWAAKTKRLHRFTLGLHLSLVWTPFKWNALHWRWDRGDFGVLSSIALHGLLFPHIQR